MTTINTSTGLLANLVATQGLASPKAGATVYWRLAGSADVACVAAALAPLAPLGITPPSAPTPEAALRRASEGASRGERRLTRRMDDRGRRLAVVHEQADATQDDLSYDVETRITLERNATGATYIVTRPHNPAIHAAYEAALTTLTSNDVALWLVRHALVKADAISLRDTGGVYFIPASSLPLWNAICGALKACSGHKFFSLPTYSDAPDAVEGILDSLSQSIGEELAQIEAKAEEGGLGERAIETQRRRVEALGAKVSRYEAALNTAAPALHEAVQRVAAHKAFGTLADLASDASLDPFAGIDFPTL